MEQSAATARLGVRDARRHASSRAGLAGSVLFLVLCLAGVVLQTKFSYDIVRDPNWLGARDTRWPIAVVTAVTAVTGGLALLVPRRLLWVAILPGGLALVTVLAAVSVAGGEAWSLAFALLTLAAAWLLGRIALSSAPFRAEGLHRRGLVPLGVGLGILGLVVLVLGRVGWIEWWTLALPTCALGLGGVFLLARGGRSLPRAALASLTESRLRAFAAGVLVLQGSVALVYAAAPEIQFDALWYKAWLPSEWADSGRIDEQTFITHPYLGIAGLTQFVAVPGHAAGAPGVGRYLQLLSIVVVIAAVWRLGDRAGRTGGPIAALAIALTPIVVWEASTAYEDLFLALVVLTAGAAVLHYEARSPAAPLAASIVVGFLAGTCITGKIHLALLAVALGIGWWVISSSGRDALRRLGGLLVGGLLGAAPLLLYRWFEFGNPVFPYYNNIFGSEHFPHVLTSFTAGESVLDQGGRGGGHGGGFDLGPLAFPWSLATDDNAYTEFAAQGVFGLLAVALFVALFFGWRATAAYRVLWGAFALGFIVWYTQLRYLRFLIPIALLGVVAMLPLLGRLDRLLRGRAATALTVAALGLGGSAYFVSNAASYFNIPGGFPLDVAIGRESDASYERRTINDAPLIQVLNRIADRNAVVVGDAVARTLLRPDIELIADWELGDLFLLSGGFTSDPAALRSFFESTGVEWLVEGDQKRLLDEEFDFLARVTKAHGQIVFADHLRDLYRIVDKPAPPQPVELCNPTFTGPDCWLTPLPLDEQPGFDDAEVAGGPVVAQVPACPGATYALEITTGPAGRRTERERRRNPESDQTRVFLMFDPPDPEQGLRYIHVPPGRTSVLYQTAPIGVSRLEIVIDPLGPAARVERVALGVADTSLRGSPCP